MTNRKRIPAIVATAVAVFIMAVMLVSAGAETRMVERERQRMAAVLDRIFRAQQQHHTETGRYADRLEDLGVSTADAGLQLSMRRYGADGWNVVVRSPALGIAPNRCGVYGGAPSSSPHRAVVKPGMVACW